jgi:hypothetical protein
MKNNQDTIITAITATFMATIIGLFIFFRPKHWEIATAFNYGIITCIIIFVLLSIIALLYITQQLQKRLKQAQETNALNSGKTHSHQKWAQQHKYLTSKNENKFKKHLQHHIPQKLEIHCNVRLVDVLTQEHSKYLFSQGKRYIDITQMHLDYVIVESDNTKIIMVIELDDPSHNDADRKNKDNKKNNTLQMAGIHYERIELDDAYEPNIMKRIIDFCKKQTG